MTGEHKLIVYIVVISLLIIWFWISSTRPNYVEKTLTEIVKYFNGSKSGYSALFKISNLDIELTFVPGNSNKYIQVKAYVQYKIKSENINFRNLLKFKKRKFFESSTPLVVRNLFNENFDLIVINEDYIEIIYYQGILSKKIGEIDWIKKTENNFSNFSELIIEMSKN